MALQGSCLCGSVRYRIEGELGAIVHCHCSQCRKASGASFATNAGVKRAEFSFVAGRSFVSEYESSPGNFRCFCKRCGSPLIKRVDADPDGFRLRLGTLDVDPGGRPTAHICVDSKAPWLEIADPLPQKP